MAVVNFQGVECCSDHLEDIRTVKRCRSRAVTVNAVWSMRTCTINVWKTLLFSKKSFPKVPFGYRKKLEGP